MREKVIFNKEVYIRIKNIIEENCDNSVVNPFGSFVTKLYLPNADIDCVVINNSQNSKNLMQKVFYNLYNDI
jgi:DNA polymerase sigma